MPRIYPEQENKAKQIERDTVKVFRENPRSFCLTSLIAELEREGKRYSRKEMLEILELLKEEGKIIEENRPSESSRTYYHLVK